MEGFGRLLRARAQELELTDAEVARRAGLTPRRYGHYVADRNEPDLRTLLRICDVLQITPNGLLGLEKAPPPRGRRARLLEQVNAALALLDDRGLRLALAQVDTLVRHSREAR